MKRRFYFRLKYRLMNLWLSMSAVYFSSWLMVFEPRLIFHSLSALCLLSAIILLHPVLLPYIFINGGTLKVWGPTGIFLRRIDAIKGIEASTRHHGKRTIIDYKILPVNDDAKPVEFSDALIDDCDTLIELLKERHSIGELSVAQYPSNQVQVLSRLAETCSSSWARFEDYMFSHDGIAINDAMIPWDKVTSVEHDAAVTGYGKSRIYYLTEDGALENITLKGMDSEDYHDSIRYIIEYATDAFIDPDILKDANKPPELAKSENRGIVFFIVAVLAQFIYGMFLNVQEPSELSIVLFVFSVLFSIAALGISVLTRIDEGLMAMLKYNIPLAAMVLATLAGFIY